MGTNYYWHTKQCNHCGRSDEPIHIGKSSAGWAFTFHGTEDIRSYAEWKNVWRNNEGEIFDEYGDLIEPDELEKLIAAKSQERRNHAFLYPDGCWVDDEGNGFDGRYFS